MININTLRFKSFWIALTGTLVMLVSAHSVSAQGGCGFVVGQGCPGTDYANFGMNSNSDAATIEYDNFVAAFHSTAVRTNDGTYKVWGQNMANDGVGNQLSPTDLNSTNYPALTGTVLKVTMGSNSTNHQAIALTTDGLFAWGAVSNIILSSAITGTNASDRALKRITVDGNPTGLPHGVNPTDVKMLFGTRGTLAVVTCSGDVWILSQQAENRGNGGAGSATQWARVETDEAGNPLLNDVVVVRGFYTGMVALKRDGTVWTWGSSTYLGNNTAAVQRTRATQMELPPAAGSIKMIGMTGSNSGPSSYYVLYADGNLYALGGNNNGQLGDWSTTARTGWVQPRYNSSSGPVMDNIHWISPQEHDHQYGSVNVLTSSSGIYNWGSSNNSMLGRGSANVNPGIPNGIAGGDEILAVETGGHTTMLVKKCESRFGYVGHRIAGSMGDGTNASDTQTTFTFETAEVQICGAASLPEIDAVEIGGGTIYYGSNNRFCNGSSIELIADVPGGVFTVVSGLATLSGPDNNVLTFIGTGNTSVVVSYTVDGDCGVVTSQRTFLTEDCTAELTLEKSGVFNDDGAGAHAGDGIAQVGETITYTFTLTNTGNYWVDNLSIADPLFQAPNPTAAITLDFGDAEQDGVLQPGEYATATVTYTITQADIDGGGVYNRATATGDYTDAGGNELQVSDESSDPNPLSPGDPGYDADRPEHTYT
ncbi:hypothetical protein JHJ32_22180, partial [Parapedobacter sp. ISTM3]|uniref:DUF7507 domain-containing protein n=1 Tax=Parapedobacter sp. ISTM3 TaxID=2800130 RepID=UPI0019046DB7